MERNSQNFVLIKNVADCALYAAKRNGRNMIIRADVIETIRRYGMSTDDITKGLVKQYSQK